MKKIILKLIVISATLSPVLSKAEDYDPRLDDRIQKIEMETCIHRLKSMGDGLLDGIVKMDEQAKLVGVPFEKWQPEARAYAANGQDPDQVACSIHVLGERFDALREYEARKPSIQNKHFRHVPE